MPKVMANGIDFYYEIHGEGQPLVLLEGLGYASWMWEQQIKDMSKHFQVIVFDNRGVGYTDKPEMEYSIKLFADDTAQVLKALNVDKAHVLGVSMGGFIAQEFTIRYPEMVDHLVLCCTSVGGPNSIPIPEETLKIMMRGGGKEDALSSAKFAISTALNEQTLHLHQDIIDFILNEQLKNPQPKQAYQRQLLAGASFNSEERVNQIIADTLIMAGRGDRVVPYGNAQMLHEKIVHSRVEILEDAGHLFFMEKPVETNELIIDFLKS